MIQLMGKRVPERSDVEVLLELFEHELFPRSAKAVSKSHLVAQLMQVLEDSREFGEFDPKSVADAMMASLDTVRENLLRDAQLSLDKDPAAQSIQEIILSYPGFRATLAYRVAHALLRAGAPLVPRMLSESIHSQTGIDINPGAQIAVPFFIDHGTGIVIGETAVIGANVHVYQGVTLGALAVDKANAGIKRHPTVGDNVVIYANSTILGGDTEIGHDSVIGGSTFLTKSVPPYSIVYNEHKTVVRDRQTMNQPIDFSI